ncbi:hypothetical protein [Thermodesulfitimonas autotrophica]|uniref:Uncharacterized protein n=1 Tax=Thermodesulfitimonas autotrophica TaxID=1894989 RepID=A0A3N5BNT8_9THEO|nr:hypothetical protein EDD75_0118 [Thermodesulfitimonas autotrophica]
MEKRCILCGRKFEVETLEEMVQEEEEDFLEPPRKIPSVCPLCQAKIKHEAEESQKVPKPM